MNEVIFPRSPRESMCGWMHLPRYIDKIRLHLAGKLHPDYQPNFGKGFDGMWLEAAGVSHEQFINVVKQTLCDGQVADWVLKNVRTSEAAKAVLAGKMFDYPNAGDAQAIERLKFRKAQAGLSDRDDIRCFVDFIDADEGRL